DAILRRWRRDPDLEREIREIGGNAVDRQQAARVRRASRNGGHVDDVDFELRRQRVVEESDRAPGERSEQVRRRTGCEVLTAKGERQIGVPVEGTRRQARPPIHQGRRYRWLRSRR